MATEDPIFEARKMMYAHCVDMHKYFLTWRERLLAGYATMLAALAIAYSWAYNESSTYFSRAICIAGIVMTFIFWGLDRRTRDLYRKCIEVGFNIEEQLGIAYQDKKQVGLYSSMRLPLNTEKTACCTVVRRIVRWLWRWARSHSGAIDILAFLALIGMVILLICPPTSKPTKNAVANPSSKVSSEPSQTGEIKTGSQ